MVITATTTLIVSAIHLSLYVFRFSMPRTIEIKYASIYWNVYFVRCSQWRANLLLQFNVDSIRNWLLQLRWISSSLFMWNKFKFKFKFISLLQMSMCRIIIISSMVHACIVVHTFFYIIHVLMPFMNSYFHFILLVSQSQLFFFFGFCICAVFIA